MRKLLFAICTAGILLGGCTEYEEPPLPVAPDDKAEETMTAVRFDISATPQQDNAVTRAVDENALSDLQLLLVGTNGARYYYDLGGKRSLVASIRRGVYTVYASSGTSTKYGTSDETFINSLDASYGDGDASLKMSYKGRADFSSGGTNNYSVKLVRTVAKMRFNVKTASNITVKNITLCHAATGTKLFPQANQGNGFADRAIGVSGGGSFTVYMAENLAGTVSSITNQKQRTAANAPANATYLLIEGEVSVDIPGVPDSSVDRKKFESRVYLGSNTTNDFNVRRNNDYRIEINIASDLSYDYRIELYDVGYRAVERLTPDGKFVWCGFGVTPFVYLYPYFKGSGQTSFKCVIEGLYRGMEVTGSSSLAVKTDAQAGTTTVSGSIDAGTEKQITLRYDAWNLTPENHRVKYALTFIDPSGGTTEYHKELRFANRSVVNVEPQSGLRYFEKTAEITAISDAYLDDEYRVSEVIGNTHQVFVFHAEKNLVLTATPLPGFTFKGWYKSGPPYKDQNRISTDPTVTLPISRRDGISYYARVEK